MPQISIDAVVCFLALRSRIVIQKHQASKLVQSNKVALFSGYGCTCR